MKQPTQINKQPKTNSTNKSMTQSADNLQKTQQKNQSNNQQTPTNTSMKTTTQINKTSKQVNNTSKKKRMNTQLTLGVFKKRRLSKLISVIRPKINLWPVQKSTFGLQN